MNQNSEFILQVENNKKKSKDKRIQQLIKIQKKSSIETKLEEAQIENAKEEKILIKNLKEKKTKKNLTGMLKTLEHTFLVFFYQ